MGLWFVTCGFLLAGCAQQHKISTGQVFVPDITRAKAMEIAEDVLADMHFNIEKADIDSGLIRTRPLPGAQFFELWRSDNVGTDNWLQANLHTIRRTVELEISRRGEELYIGCDVQVQRLSLPERQISSSARAYEMFSRSSPSLQKLSLHHEQKQAMTWIDLDKDRRFAAEIIKRIEERITTLTKDKSLIMENKT